MNRLFVVGWLVGLASLRPATAQAFCRSTACDPLHEVCETDAQGCPVTGKPLQWPIPCVGVSLNQSASAQVSYAELERVVRASFDAWNQVSCDGQTPSITATVLGPVACDGPPKFNDGGGNANLVVFRDGDWPYAAQASVLALTTVSYGSETGIIYGADMEVRAKPGDVRLTTGDDDVANDLQSIVTHEAGHFLGLAHSNIEIATMWSSYQTGQTSLRTLEADDVAGLCAAYPHDRAGLPACDPGGPSPRSLGLASACDGSDLVARSDEGDDGGGCRAAAVGDGTGRGAGVAVGLVALAAIGRRRRRARAGGCYARPGEGTGDRVVAGGTRSADAWHGERVLPHHDV